MKCVRQCSVYLPILYEWNTVTVYITGDVPCLQCPSLTVSVQALNDDDLLRLNRSHCREDALRYLRSIFSPFVCVQLYKIV